MTTMKTLIMMAMTLLAAFDLTVVDAHHFHGCSFDAIYQFGDSISDTGNLIRETGGGGGPFSAIAHLPYGETYFNRSTGRCSNGRLMIDFLAQAVHLPLLNPYLDKNASFTHGVNFAVAGATASDFSFFAQRNILLPVTNSSLAVQLNWFRTHLGSLCSSATDCMKKLNRALFMMGTVGGNDYNYAFLQGKTIEEVRAYVPHVVHTITDAIEEVIDLGAIRIVVPGNFPIGCIPVYLTMFGRSNHTTPCLEDFNDFAKYHNNYLQHALKRMREEHPGVDILYADFYNTLHGLLAHARFLGFAEDSTLKACCGTGGDYNFNATNMCGAEGVSICKDPERMVHWDGVHLTQRAYEFMARVLITKLHKKMRCN